MMGREESAEPGADWRTGLQQEWQVLHGEHAQADRTGLLLKAGAILLSFATVALAVDVLLACLVLLVLWLQEGILRTVQERVGERLLAIEGLLRSHDAVHSPAFQLHSTWLQRRGGNGALLGEYFRHAVRPTVAYPYAVLVAILLLAWLMPAAV